MNWNQLKTDGYKVVRKQGTYKSNKVIIYQVENNGSICCIVNFKAAILLKKQFGFEIIKDSKEICYLNKPDGYNDFSTQKEPLILTFHKN